MSTPDQELFRAVIWRAICDALGFTNESKARDKAPVDLRGYEYGYDLSSHTQCIEQARQWFYDGGDDFEFVCFMADFVPSRVREGTLRLIEARQSGDHSRIPEYWRKAFRANRMPSFTAFADDIDEQLKRR